MTRFLLLTVLLAAAGALAGCPDETTAPTQVAGDSGTDTGSDAATTSDVSGADTEAGSCASGVECVRTRDCLSAGLANNSCTDGCCAPSGTDPDAGGPDPVECGDVTFQGECDGDTVVWCNEGTLGSVDCAAFYPEGITGTCEWFDDEFGFWCGAQEGDPCIFDAGEGPQPALCAGDRGACALGTDGTACIIGVDACVEDTFEQTCLGDLLAVDCNILQPIVWDCAAFGGTCTDAVCTGATEGNECGADFVVCADGLVCDGETDSALGTCIVGDGPAPTCEDSIQNGDEEGVDCGGSCPDDCEVAPLPTCDDEEQNGDEEGVDCGGSCPDDCEVAPLPTCDDEEQNGDEEGVDCGGSCPTACAD